MICAACCAEVNDMEDYLCCSKETCKKYYHYLCAGGRSLIQSRNLWICPECCCATKKGGDNSGTPVGSTKKMPRDENVTLRKKVSSSCLLNDSSIIISQMEDSPIEEIHSLRQEIQSLKGQLNNTVSLISNYELQISNYNSEVKELHKKLDDFITYFKVTSSSLLASTAVESSTQIPKSEVSTLTTLAPELVVGTVPLEELPGTSDQRYATPMGPPSIPAPLPSKSKRRQPKVNGDKYKLDKLPNPQPISIQNVNIQPVSVIDVENATIDQQPLGDEWTEVMGKKKKKSLRPASLCCTAGPTKTTLKAVQPRKYLHLWNMESSIDEVKAYLEQLYPAEACTVQELKPRGDYRSYKIGVPTTAFEMFFSTDVWPVNAKLKVWIPYQKVQRSPVDNTQEPKIVSTQPFRAPKK